MSDLPTREIFNSNTQQMETATLRVDKNNEIVATFEDGSFLKFPSTIIETAPAEEGGAVTTRPVTPEDLDGMVEAERVHNEGQEIITPEMEAAAAAAREAGLLAIGVDINDPEAVAAATAPIPPVEPELTPNEATDGNTMPEGDKTNAPTNDIPDN